MRARSIAVLAVVPMAFVAIACGLSVGGLLVGAPDASSGVTLDGPQTLDSSVSGSDDAPTGPGDASPGPPDAPSDAPAAIDASPPVDAYCPGVVCNSACTGAPTCAGCNGSPLLCATTGACLASCDTCPGRPIECSTCNFNRVNPVGTCEVLDASAYCLNSNYSYHCGCQDQDAQDCPNGQQVCQDNGFGANICYTCGENNTDGVTCKDGKKCKESKASCQ